MLHKACGVTKSQDHSTQSSNSWYPKTNMRDRAYRTIVHAMGIAIGDLYDTMVQKQQEQEDEQEQPLLKLANDQENF